MRLKTSVLTDLVSPMKLKEALEILRQSGDVISYIIEPEYTVILASKSTEVQYLLEEESHRHENPRPYVANRRSKK